MSISKDSEGIFVVLMCVVLFLSLFSTVGCGGRLRQQLAEYNSLKEQCESDRAQLRKTLRQTETNFQEAESEIEDLTQKIDELERSNRQAQLKCSNDLKQAEQQKADLELQKQSLERDLKHTESELRKFRNNNGVLTKKLKEEETKNKTLDGELKQCRLDAEKELKEAHKRTEKVTSEKVQVEKERDRYKKLAGKVPEAKINTVRFEKDRDRLRRHGIRITGQFSVSNRNGHEVWAIAHFYFEDGRKLEDRNNKYVHEDQVTVREKFDIDYVKPNKNETFDLFIPFDELHVEQKHKLKFSIRIYDKSTKSYLEKAPHEKKFEYNPEEKKIQKKID